MLGRFRFFKRLFLELPQQVRLAYCLMRDPRVPAYTRAAYIGGLGILLTPVINLPEAIPVVGELDALAMTLLATRLFIAACPDEVVIEQEQLIIEERSRFHEDVRKGEKIALAISGRFRHETDHDVVGSANYDNSESAKTSV